MGYYSNLEIEVSNFARKLEYIRNNKPIDYEIIKNDTAWIPITDQQFNEWAIKEIEESRVITEENKKHKNWMKKLEEQAIAVDMFKGWQIVKKLKIIDANDHLKYEEWFIKWRDELRESRAKNMHMYDLANYYPFDKDSLDD